LLFFILHLSDHCSLPILRSAVICVGLSLSASLETITSVFMTSNRGHSVISISLFAAHSIALLFKIECESCISTISNLEFRHEWSNRWNSTFSSDSVSLEASKTFRVFAVEGLTLNQALKNWTARYVNSFFNSIVGRSTFWNQQLFSFNFFLNGSVIVCHGVIINFFGKSTSPNFRSDVHLYVQVAD
jgi:hypothetical protein